MKRKYSPWFEASVDTIIGTLINFPLNIVLLYMAAELELSIMTTGVMLTTVFFIFAIVRKALTRIFFKKREEN